MTASPKLSSAQPMDTSWSATSPNSKSPQLAAKTSPLAETEMQEVQNLPFESAKLKANHYSWTPRCSDGIQSMLISRQHRHEVALDAYTSCRSAQGFESFVQHLFQLLTTSAAKWMLLHHLCFNVAETELMQACSQSLLSMQLSASKLWMLATQSLNPSWMLLPAAMSCGWKRLTFTG